MRARGLTPAAATTVGAGGTLPRVALKHIVETGKPTGPGWRHVRPPAPVEVDLQALFPLPPHHELEPIPDGLDLRRTVVGRLSIWGRAAEGDWWGLVTYPTTPAAIGSDTAAAAEAVSHWVPGHLVRPVGDSFTGPQPPF